MKNETRAVLLKTHRAEALAKLEMDIERIARAANDARHLAPYREYDAQLNEVRETSQAFSVALESLRQAVSRDQYDNRDEIEKLLEGETE